MRNMGLEKAKVSYKASCVQNLTGKQCPPMIVEVKRKVDHDVGG